MKRKKNTVEKKSRIRVVYGDIGFDLIYASNHTVELDIQQLSKQSDTMQYKVTFLPALTKRIASFSRLKILHMPTKRSDIDLVIIPKTDEMEIVQLEGVDYLVFATHAIELTSTGNVSGMYFTMQNTQMRGDLDHQPIWNIAWPLKHSRYKALPFYPCDRTIDRPFELIPQNIPPWFKIRGEISGSGIPELLGFFVPDNVKDYLKGLKKDFSGWKGVNARFGHLSEERGIVSILAHDEHLEFHECGYYRHPTVPSWGSSPDGILFDPTIKFPKNYAITCDDPTRGVCEIKSSRWNSKFAGYYFPQCIWEMLCANTQWCRLIRYAEPRESAPECKFVNIFRHLPTEEQITRLVVKSLEARKTSPQAFVELVHTEEYVAMRKHFDDMALQCDKIATQIPVPIDLISEMEDARRAHMEHQDEDLPPLHPAIDRIDERQADIFRLFQEPRDTHQKQLLQNILDQMADYNELLKTIIF